MMAKEMLQDADLILSEFVMGEEYDLSQLEIYQMTGRYLREYMGKEMESMDRLVDELLKEPLPAERRTKLRSWNGCSPRRRESFFCCIKKICGFISPFGKKGSLSLRWG